MASTSSGHTSVKLVSVHVDGQDKDPLRIEAELVTRWQAGYFHTHES